MDQDQGNTVVLSIDEALEFSGSVFTLSIAALLRPWADNPRKVKNPDYDDIKQSILSTGYKDVLTVTRAPGADHYIPRTGANTRAEILGVLAADDPERDPLRVSFEPWPGNDQMLSDALVENSARGSLNTVDQAASVAELLKVRFGDSDDFSFKHAAEELKKQGHKYTPKSLKNLDYLNKEILPMMPNKGLAFLRDDLGPSGADIERLSTILNCYKKIAVDSGEGVSDNHYQVFVQSALSSVDDNEFSFERLHSQFDQIVSDNCGLEISQVKDLADKFMVESGKPANPQKKSKGPTKTPSVKAGSEGEGVAKVVPSVAEGAIVALAQSLAKLVGMPEVVMPFDHGLRVYAELPSDELDARQMTV